MGVKGGSFSKITPGLNAEKVPLEKAFKIANV